MQFVVSDNLSLPLFSDQKPHSAKCRWDLDEVVSARLPCPTSRFAHQMRVIWRELMAWNSAEIPAPPWSSTRKPKGSSMALPNFSPPPQMGAKLEEKWWITRSNIGSGKRAIGNQALLTGPQVSNSKGHQLCCPLVFKSFTLESGFWRTPCSSFLVDCFLKLHAIDFAFQKKLGSAIRFCPSVHMWTFREYHWGTGENRIALVTCWS